jgi:hypothetical protein
MMHGNLTFIKNASSIKSEPEKKIMDGIVKGSLNDFQKKGIDGLLSGGMPHHSKEPSGNKPSVKASGKAPATKLKNGSMPSQGSDKTK